MNTEQQIQEYVTGEMTAQERAEFEKMLSHDDSLMDEVRAYRAALEVTRQHRRQELKVQLSNIERAQPGARVRKMSWQRIAIAAAASVALVICAYLVLQNAPQSPQELYVEYYTEYRDPVSVRGDENQSTENAAYAAYRAGDYQTAISVFSQVESPSEMARFYHGLALLKTDQFVAAAGRLDAVSSGNSTYQQQASWYAILAVLNLGNVEQSVSRLQDHLSHSNYMQDEARELMEELQRLK